LAFEHHAFRAAKRPIVHGAMAIVRPVAQIVYLNVQQACVFAAFHHAMRKRPLEEFGEDREHMEDHGRFKSFSPSGNSTAIRLAAGSISTQMDLANGISSRSSTTSSPAPPP